MQTASCFVLLVITLSQLSGAILYPGPKITPRQPLEGVTSKVTISPQKIEECIDNLVPLCIVQIISSQLSYFNDSYNDLQLWLQTERTDEEIENKFTDLLADEKVTHFWTCYLENYPKCTSVQTYQAGSF